MVQEISAPKFVSSESAESLDIFSRGLGAAGQRWIGFLRPLASHAA